MMMNIRQIVLTQGQHGGSCLLGCRFRERSTEKPPNPLRAVRPPGRGARGVLVTEGRPWYDPEGGASKRRNKRIFSPKPEAGQIS